MKLVISREKWLRGEGPRSSQLYRKSDNKMCCLGFLGLACGLEIKDIEGFTTPAMQAPYGQSVWPSQIVDEMMSHNSPLTRQLMMTNDNDSVDLSSEEREAKLIELFKRADIDVEFVP